MVESRNDGLCGSSIFIKEAIRRIHPLQFPKNCTAPPSDVKALTREFSQVEYLIFIKLYSRPGYHSYGNSMNF